MTRFGEIRMSSSAFARVAPLAAALLIAGCNPDPVLDVPDPDVVRPETLTGKSALPALRSLRTPGPFPLRRLDATVPPPRVKQPHTDSARAPNPRIRNHEVHEGHEGRPAEAIEG